MLNRALQPPARGDPPRRWIQEIEVVELDEMGRRESDSERQQIDDNEISMLREAGEVGGFHDRTARSFRAVNTLSIIAHNEFAGQNNDAITWEKQEGGNCWPRCHCLL